MAEACLRALLSYTTYLCARASETQWAPAMVVASKPSRLPSAAERTRCLTSRELVLFPIQHILRNTGQLPPECIVEHTFMPPQFTGLWRHWDFLKLWGAQTTSVFGTQLASLAYALTAVLTLQATPFQIGLLNAVSAAS